MTPPPSSPPQGGREYLDTGPLSWVIGEIREALNRSKLAVQEALDQDAEARVTTLRHAKSYLHQAHGALQIVDVDGVALITETVEDLFDRMEAGQLELSSSIGGAIESAYQALIEYLEELLSGLPHQPVRLFPYYRALLEARGAERIHPADLFFPNLSIRPRFPGTDTTDDVAPQRYVQLRQQYERALLPFLRSSDPAQERANAARMRDLIAQIEQLQAGSQARAFWWVMHGLAEAVTAGAVPNEIYVKQLFARINLQIRRLCQGSSSIAERLLRDALFFIAGIAQPSALARQIREVYELDGLVPADYERKRYGQVDVDALARARQHLTQAKTLWNRIAGGDAGVAESFEHEMRLLAEAGAGLNMEPLTKFLKELKGISRHAAHGRPDDALGLEMATGLLFVEGALNHITQLPDDFAERADGMTARLLAIVAGEAPAPGVSWIEDMSREAQQRQTMAALAGEMQASLRQVEKSLDEYFRDPSQQAGLESLDGILHQIEGALAVLDEQNAMQAVRHTREAVQGFLAAAPGDADQQRFQQVAQNVGALSFFIESLQLGSEQAKRDFTFDPERGVFEARLFDRAAADEKNQKVVEVSADPDGESQAVALQGFATVEDELERRQRESAELARVLAQQPDDPALQQRLRESLEQVQLDARLVDKPEVTDRARAGLALLDQSDLSASRESLARLAGEVASPLPESQPVAAPGSDEEIDAELLEIFLAEAEEVLATVRQTLPDSREVPHSQEHLTTLRRCFHTLKGSSRMVGLVSFGEAAWSIEQVLNLRLSENRAGDPDLYGLLETAARFLGAWVEDLKERGSSDRRPDALVRAAQAVREGASFVYEEAAEASAPAPATATPDKEESDAALDSAGAVEQAAAEVDEAGETGEGGEPALLSDTSLADEAQAPEADVPLFAADDVPALEEASQEQASAEPGQVIAFPPPSLGLGTDDNIKRIGDIEISVPLYNIYLAETDDLARLLASDLGEWRHEPERHVNVQAVHAAHSLAGSSATVGLEPLHELAHALELVLQFLLRRPVTLKASEFDTLEYSVERMKLMLRRFALGEMPAYEPGQVGLLDMLRHQLEARASQQQAEAEASEIERAAAPDVPAEESAAPTALPASESEPISLNDEIDPDLLPVFIEEGRDILPQVGEMLRNWQREPDNVAWPQSVMRLLHTVKGSARMAGAMNLGQHLHEMETRAENASRLGLPTSLAIDDLLARYDQVLQMFEQLQNPQSSDAVPAQDQATTASASEPVVLTPVVPVTEGKGTAPALPGERAATSPLAPAAQSPLVRVRADILDRLVNQAGEVSISRSRLETEVGTLRQSLSELTENVARLREQLREVEMQAESQIASRMQQVGEREFDPLEFDRFTRLQELTRMMAESVSDVSSVNHTIARTLDSAVSDLGTQARLTRELQQDLMRVRMVQFASIAERLFRVSRQAAKELDKRVNLDIRGGAVELDRGVLERMTGPFEHLLRNAIVHGIESREARRAAGKSEVGELLIEVRQEGNEVVLQFTDDGRGLDLERIRERAIGLGLVAADADLPEDEVRDLIFHPGFSTAEEVTELAGRGVGMDVVRAEAAALGGRVETRSAAGGGTCFTIHLPLTLAVTQVVLLTTGGRTYAVPSVLVEQVQHLKANALATAYNDGTVVWQDQRVPLYYLSTLLGDAKAAPVAQQYTPLVILKSGNDRVALHVDEIIGNREVVVKNIGPQLARMVGIAGATVLGSGDIVLILNPVPLAQRTAQEDVRAPSLADSGMREKMGAVAEVGDAGERQAGPVQGLRTQNIVMVVDDSLTVRRVTQRLLSREGYQVVLAKDGVDALERLQSITPDVMLVDIEMPRMDGFDLTRNVRGDECTRHIPIIMITSRTAAKHRNYAMELGVNEYLGKPYREEQLLALIADYVNDKAAIDQAN